MGSSDHELLDGTLRSLRSLGVSADDSLLIGVSGGVDSMTLLGVLIELRERSALRDVEVCHVNHALRGAESDEDEARVRAFAHNLNCRLHVGRFDTKSESAFAGKGVEETARDERYRFFQKIAEQCDIRFVATAHTAEDQSETVLMNLMRGAGLKGLSGIPPRRSLGRSTIVRPWLAFTRDTIERHAERVGIPFAIDSSNASLEYTRNRVRHIVVPALKEAFAGRDIANALGRMALHAASASNFIESEAGAVFERLSQGSAAGYLPLQGLQQLHPALLKHVLERWLASSRDYNLSMEESERLAAVIRGEEAATDLKYGIRIRKFEDSIRMEMTGPQEEPGPIEIRRLCDDYRFGGVGIRFRIAEGAAPIVSNRVGSFDRRMVRLPLLLRAWKSGERIEAFGMGGRSKLVSDLLRESGVEESYRRGYPVLVSAARPERILCIPGIRSSRIAPVTESTKQTLQVTRIDEQ